jgi:photosystem II stability/assembly factor-like uncharacterized protein
LIASFVASFAVNSTATFAVSEMGVFRTMDEGASWICVNNDMPGATSAISLAACGDKIFVGTLGGVYKSINNGANWSLAHNGLPVSYLSIGLASDGYNLYAITDEKNIYKSTDYGGNWYVVYTLLPAYTVDRAIYADGPNVYVGEWGQVIMSNNGGLNWSIKDWGLPLKYITAFATNASSIFVSTGGDGVYLSVNNGSTWASTGLSNEFCQTLALNMPTLFTGTAQHGVLASSDNGGSWNPINTGLTNNRIEILSVIGNYLLAGTYGSGVWKRLLTEITGLNPVNIPESGISVYPNPAMEKITIGLPGLANLHNTVVSIYNARGELLIQRTINNRREDIYVGYMTRGVYYLRITDDHYVTVRKFVKE